MASYQPPSEFLPIFDNSVFTATNSSSTSTGGGLTLAQANLLFLRKNFPDICTALETFNGGISTTFLNASGNIQSNTKLITNNIESILSGDTVTLYNNQTNGVLNIANNSTRTANINIGTNATSGQTSLGSSNNTQTNIYGGAIYLANTTTINSNLSITGGGVIIGYLTSAIAAATYATIASLSSYLTIASASATYLTQISASTTYATIASLSSYLTTATASATYLTQISASTTYATIASLASYLTTATASATYATIASLSSYLTIASAASTYLTQSNASSTYATIASLSAYLTTASAASTYLTQSNASSTYATIASLSSYLTTATAASTYATISSLSSYLTTATASTTYATIASLSSYLTTTTASATYATIASLSSYLTTATASTTYAPINAPTFTTSIGLTSGNITASSGNIIANGIIRNNGNTGSISNTGAIVGTSLGTGTGSITGTYGSITQTLNNYTIAGTYNVNLDTPNGSGTVVIGSTIGKVNIGKVGGGASMNFYGDINMYNMTQLAISGDISMVNGDISARSIFLNGNIDCYYINTTAPAGPDFLCIGNDPLKTSEIRMSAITNYYANLNMISGNINGGTGNITNTGTLNTGAITCTSINITAGTITYSDLTVDNLLLNSGGKITCATTSPTLINTSLGYYYNYPSVSYTGINTTGYKFNPITNTASGVNYFKAGYYLVNMNSIVRFTGATTSGNFTYNLGAASGTTTGTVTTSTVTDISPVSGNVRNFYFGNILNVDLTNSHTLCIQLASDSFVNLFINFSSFTIAGGTVTAILNGNIMRIS